MDLWVATGNAGKLAEIKSLLMDLPIRIRSQKELPNYYSPEENGDSFLKNAQIKARSLKKIVGDQWVVAEDSGLVVDGLNGLPGIHSARYAGPRANDLENVAKLLKMISIKSPLHRKAHFITQLVAISPNNEEFCFEGLINGEISKKVQGKGGFGYDPCFIPSGEQKTFAELGIGYKNKNSHRAKAIKMFKEELKKFLISNQSDS